LYNSTYSNQEVQGMGIPFYFRVITRECRGILSATPPAKCKNYYVDFNGMIHQAAQRVIRRVADNNQNQNQFRVEAIEQDICDETWDYLQECVAIIKPKKIHICIDGVAPIAKMAQQRKRRFLSLKRHQLEKTTPVWDTNNITPGTAFMTKLQDRIKWHINEYKTKIQGTREYVLSAADEPGEGEHKIFAQIARDNETSYVYGLDADLIMLSLMAHRPGIFLMRENPSEGDKSATTEETYTYLDVDKLRIGILTQVIEKYKWTVDPVVIHDPFGQEAKNTIESYLVLCFLLGNDFLPHITSLSLKKDGHVKLLQAATIVHGRIVTDGNINMEALLEVLKELQKDETDTFLAVNTEYLNMRNYTSRNTPAGAATGTGTGTAANGTTTATSVVNADSYPMGNKDTVLATAISLAGQKWRSVYYKHCFNTRINDTKIVVSACKLFLTGIPWTYAYYKRDKIDAGWYYPYGYAPSILDLANTLSASQEEFAGILDKWRQSHPALTFVHPDVQLLTVLPPTSVPPILQRYTTDPSLGLAHLFPVEYPIKTYLCEKLWQCVPVLPPIDIARVTQVLALV